MYEHQLGKLLTFFERLPKTSLWSSDQIQVMWSYEKSISTFVRFIANKCGRPLALGRIYSTQKRKLSPSFCFLYCSKWSDQKSIYNLVKMKSSEAKLNLVCFLIHHVCKLTRKACWPGCILVSKITLARLQAKYACVLVKHSGSLAHKPHWHIWHTWYAI